MLYIILVLEVNGLSWERPANIKHQKDFIIKEKLFETTSLLYIMIYKQLNLYFYNLIIHQYIFELIHYKYISGHIQLHIASEKSLW